MLNNTGFSNRLKKVMEFYNISASNFAETIDVPRSSISHILSGRNKPSLEFVLKTIETYHEVDLYWLLKGIGSFPKSHPTPVEPNLFNNQKKNISSTKEKNNAALRSNNNTVDDLITSDNNSSTIEKVLIFYSDGTFKEYNRKN